MAYGRPVSLVFMATTLILANLFVGGTGNAQISKGAFTIDKTGYHVGDTIVVQGTTKPSGEIGLIVLDPEKKPYLEKEASAGNDGIVLFSFQLTNDAKLGDWTIQITADNELQEIRFAVSEPLEMPRATGIATLTVTGKTHSISLNNTGDLLISSLIITSAPEKIAFAKSRFWERIRLDGNTVAFTSLKKLEPNDSMKIMLKLDAMSGTQEEGIHVMSKDDLMERLGAKANDSLSFFQDSCESICILVNPEDMIPQSLKSPIVPSSIKIVSWTNAVRDAIERLNRENLPVWRAQIKLETANVEHAGTDDSVKVELNPNNFTWLDHPGDDRKRNAIYTYDLLLDNVRKISDITRLRIAKDSGSDGWCIKKLTLIINGAAIYEKLFGSTYTTCNWLDTDEGYSTEYRVESSLLRAYSMWQNYIPAPPLMGPLPFSIAMPSAELRSRVIAFVGHYLHGQDLKWGTGDFLYGAAVETSAVNTNTVDVDLDLQNELNNAPDIGVDLNIALQFSCSSGEINLNTWISEARIDMPWLYALVTFGISEYIEDDMNSSLEEMLNNYPFLFFDTVSIANIPGSFCPFIYTFPDGLVGFQVPPAYWSKILQ